MHQTTHDLPTRDLETRVERDVARAVMAGERRSRHRTLQLLLARGSAPKPCHCCGAVLPAQALVNRGRDLYPRWVCGLCDMLEAPR